MAKIIYGKDANEHCRRRLRPLIKFFDPARIDYEDHGKSESITMTMKDGRRIKLYVTGNSLDGGWLVPEVLKSA